MSWRDEFGRKPTALSSIRWNPGVVVFHVSYPLTGVQVLIFTDCFDCNLVADAVKIG